MRNIKTKAFEPYGKVCNEAPAPAEGKEINYSGSKEYTSRPNGNYEASKHSEMNDPFSAKESLQNGLTLREKL